MTKRYTIHHDPYINPNAYCTIHDSLVDCGDGQRIALDDATQKAQRFWGGSAACRNHLGEALAQDMPTPQPVTQVAIYDVPMVVTVTDGKLISVAFNANEAIPSIASCDMSFADASAYETAKAVWDLVQSMAKYEPTMVTS